tara:strand:- start:844 stop:1113 length:270 start_codon:yes stop_codon:yes gene_type:complete
MDLSFINGSHFALITLFAMYHWHMTSKFGKLDKELETTKEDAKKWMCDALEKDEIIMETLQKIDYRLGSEAKERRKQQREASGMYEINK